MDFNVLFYELVFIENFPSLFNPALYGVSMAALSPQPVWEPIIYFVANVYRVP